MINININVISIVSPQDKWRAIKIAFKYKGWLLSRFENVGVVFFSMTVAVKSVSHPNTGFLSRADPYSSKDIRSPLEDH